MRVLAVFALFIALAAAVPAPPSPQQIEQSNVQNDLLAADANPQVDNADRSKRFIFFSKVFYPYPFSYTKIISAPVLTPVITPIVTKTKVVAVAPPPATITYRVRPVTYQYTIPSYTIVKAVPAAYQVETAVPAVQATVTKTATVAEASVATADDEE